MTPEATAVGLLAMLGVLATGCGSNSTPSGVGGAPAAAPSSPGASSSFYSGTSPATSPNFSPSPSPSPTAASCSRSVHRSGTTVTVGLADDTSTVCLAVGEQLRVVLPPDVKGGWAQVGVVGPALSRPETSTGGPGGRETVATTQATGPGTGRVLAVQACPGQQGCRSWVVEVRVRSAA